MRNFKLNVLFRIAILIALILLLLYCFHIGELYIEYFLLLTLISISMYNLFRYIDKTNQDIASFLQGIQYNDFTMNYATKYKGKSFAALYNSFNLISQKFQDIRAEKEAHFHYLNHVVEHVHVGLVCFDQEQKVVLMNQALKDLLQKVYLVNLDSFKNIDLSLYQALQSLGTNERKLIKIVIDNKLISLAMEATDFKLQGNEYRLISFQNIQAELEQEELQAWQKLIRTLRHEIMNSITPITTLAATVDEQLQEQTESLSAAQISDIQEAVHAIRKRSEALFRFTDSYHHLNLLQKLNFQEVELTALLKNIKVLFSPILSKKNIRFELRLPKQAIVIPADPDLLEQALINLLKNAIDAVETIEQAHIQVQLVQREQKVSIYIQDNGIGMDNATLEQIFVPFYTTKAEGTGIGLNLSRQIMHLHKGNIQVKSVLGDGSIFILNF